MSKYRKKPVVIEAELISVLIQNALNSDCPSQPIWVRKGVDEEVLSFSSDAVFIKTLEGTMRGEKDDYLILGVQGEMYPCKPDIFEKTYEKVE